MLGLTVTTVEIASKRSFRDRMRDVGWYVLIGLFVITLPVSFPLLIAYKKIRREKLRGKGVGALFFLWLVTTAISSLLVAAYAKKGLAGLGTLGLILLGGVVWAFVVFAFVRLLLWIFVGMIRLWDWIRKQAHK